MMDVVLSAKRHSCRGRARFKQSARLTRLVIRGLAAVGHANQMPFLRFRQERLFAIWLQRLHLWCRQWPRWLTSREMPVTSQISRLKLIWEDDAKWE
jgi:hypothetical protein